MARSRSSRRKRSVASSGQVLGAGLCVIGFGSLVLPVLVGSSTVLKAVAVGLRYPGGLALILGAVVLVIDHLTQDKIAEVDSESGYRPVESAHGARGWPPEGRTANAGDGGVGHPRSALAPRREAAWSPAVFAAIEWRRFEAVCEKLFAQAGFETRSQSHGSDGGVDIWLHSRHAKGPVAVVQCKHWQGKAVGVKELREFFGVMASHKIRRGTYATTSTYTADARKFAKDNGVNALDGDGMLALIAQRTPEQQQALLDVAFEGEYWRPTCASCGIKMVERTPTKGGRAFWGCSNYPDCRSKLAMQAGQTQASLD